jgi:hypothetical protein
MIEKYLTDTTSKPPMEQRILDKHFFELTADTLLLK